LHSPTKNPVSQQGASHAQRNKRDRRALLFVGLSQRSDLSYATKQSRQALRHTCFHGDTPRLSRSRDAWSACAKPDECRVAAEAGAR
jgi:hypothetical protein